MRDVSGEIANNLKQVYFGGNWTSVSIKETLADVSWQEATAELHSLNSIAVLLFHLNYYVAEVAKVLKGAPLAAKDAYSFSAPLISSTEDWAALQAQAWADATQLAALIAEIPDEQLALHFDQEQYGSHYRNFHGIIEHVHYHLGQISLIKKMLRASG